MNYLVISLLETRNDYHGAMQLNKTAGLFNRYQQYFCAALEFA
jgi:hypothetical protein